MMEWVRTGQLADKIFTARNIRGKVRLVTFSKAKTRHHGFRKSAIHMII